MEEERIIHMTRPDGQPVTVNATLYPDLVEKYKAKGFKIGYKKPKVKKEAE